MIKIILKYLDELYPNPKCELNYNNDYEFLIAVMLSAQTTDKKVNEVTAQLFKEYYNLESFVNADINDIERIIKPIGTYKKKSVFIKEIVNELFYNNNGKVPQSFKALESLNGVGHKTASLVLGTIYNIPTFPVDTHVSRVSKRLGLVNIEDDVVKIEKKLKNIFDEKHWVRIHHQLVLFGRYNCKAKNPDCLNCKLKHICKKE